MNVAILPTVDTTHLNDLLLEDGAAKPVSHATLQQIPHQVLQVWCVRNAIYQIPTIELIEWLNNRIAGRKAIEIGSGKGGIGRALGIVSSDNYSQTLPKVRLYYAALKQAPIEPPPFVERLEAEAAIAKYKPEVVVGAFITHKYHEGETDGNMYGPEEESWMGKVEYIHIGNETTHKNKRILKYAHDSLKFPWLVSRAIAQTQNVIWVWR